MAPDAWIWGVIAGEWLVMIAMATFVGSERDLKWTDVALWSSIAAIVMFGGAMVVKALEGQ